MLVNKNKYRIQNNKKVLHKVGKRWVTVSAMVLALLGGTSVASHMVKGAHADAVNGKQGNAQVGHALSAGNALNADNGLHVASQGVRPSAVQSAKPAQPRVNVQSAQPRVQQPSSAIQRPVQSSAIGRQLNNSIHSAVQSNSQARPVLNSGVRKPSVNAKASIQSAHVNSLRNNGRIDQARVANRSIISHAQNLHKSIMNNVSVRPQAQRELGQESNAPKVNNKGIKLNKEAKLNNDLAKMPFANPSTKQIKQANKVDFDENRRQGVSKLMKDDNPNVGNVNVSKNQNVPEALDTIIWKDGSKSDGNEALSGAYGTKASIDNVVPEGYHLASGQSDEIPLDNQIHVVQVAKDISNSNGHLPVDANNVNVVGRIYLHFTDGSNNQNTSVYYSGQYVYGQPAVNVLNGLRNSTINVKDPSAFVGKNINGINTNNYSYDHGTGIQFKPTASDAHYVDQSTADVVHNVDLYYTSTQKASDQPGAQGNETVDFDYTDPQGNTNVVKSDKNISGKNGAQASDNNVPANYHVDPNSSTKYIHQNGKTQVINVLPNKETDTFNFVNSDNQPVGKPSTATGNQKSDISSKNVPNIPNGYHVASDSNIPMDGKQHNVKVTPNNDTDYIHFNGDSDVNTNNLTKNGKNGQTSDVSAPAHYQFTDGKSSEPFTYNGGTHNFNVQRIPNQETTTFTTPSDKPMKGVAPETTTGQSDTKGTVNAPAGYHFKDGSKTAPVNYTSKDGKQNLPIYKDSANDTINYYDLKGHFINSQTFSGTPNASFDVNKSDANIPSNYKLQNADNNFKYGDGNHDVRVIGQDNDDIVFDGDNSADYISKGSDGSKDNIKVPSDYELAKGESTQFTHNNHVHIYHVNRIQSSDTVTFNKGNGQPAQSSKVKGGKGTEGTVVAPKGYHFSDGKPADDTTVKTFIYGDNQGNHNFNIAKDKAGANITYIDHTGHFVASDALSPKSDGTVSDIKNGNTPNLPNGYKLAKNDNNVTYNNDANYVIPVVGQRTDHIIYVDKAGNEHGDDYIKGYSDANIDVNAQHEPNIENGYQASNDNKFAFDGQNHFVPVQGVPVDAQSNDPRYEVTVKAQKKFNGNNDGADETVDHYFVKGNVGDKVTINPTKYVPNGFSQSASDYPMTGTITANGIQGLPQNNVVQYNYLKNSNADNSVTVHYTNNGKTLSSGSFAKDNGQKVSDVTKDVPVPAGYHVDPSANKAYQFTDSKGDMNIAIDPDSASQLPSDTNQGNVRYNVILEDANGNVQKVLTSDANVGNVSVGSPFSINAPSENGYNEIKGGKVFKGSVTPNGATPRTHTFVFRAVANNANVPASNDNGQKLPNGVKASGSTNGPAHITVPKGYHLPPNANYYFNGNGQLVDGKGNVVKNIPLQGDKVVGTLNVYMQYKDANGRFKNRMLPFAIHGEVGGTNTFNPYIHDIYSSQGYALNASALDGANLQNGVYTIHFTPSDITENDQGGFNYNPLVRFEYDQNRQKLGKIQIAYIDNTMIYDNKSGQFVKGSNYGKQIGSDEILNASDFAGKFAGDNVLLAKKGAGQYNNANGDDIYYVLNIPNGYHLQNELNNEVLVNSPAQALRMAESFHVNLGKGVGMLFIAPISEQEQQPAQPASGSAVTPAQSGSSVEPKSASAVAPKSNSSVAPKSNAQPASASASAVAPSASTKSASASTPASAVTPAKSASASSNASKPANANSRTAKMEAEVAQLNKQISSLEADVAKRANARRHHASAKPSVTPNVKPSRKTNNAVKPSRKAHKTVTPSVKPSRKHRAKKSNVAPSVKPSTKPSVKPSRNNKPARRVIVPTNSNKPAQSSKSNKGNRQVIKGNSPVAKSGSVEPEASAPVANDEDNDAQPVENASAPASDNDASANVSAPSDNVSAPQASDDNSGSAQASGNKLPQTDEANSKMAGAGAVSAILLGIGLAGVDLDRKHRARN